MVKAGFKTFYLGFESKSLQWQKQTGAKVFSEELACAVEYLKAAGVESENITAYQILGHPDIVLQQLEESMYFITISQPCMRVRVDYELCDFTEIEMSKQCLIALYMTQRILHLSSRFK